jgi:hypothetical protein
VFGKLNFIDSLKRAFGLSVPHTLANRCRPNPKDDRSKREFVCGTILHSGEERRLQRVAEALLQNQKNSPSESCVATYKYRDDRMFIMQLNSGFKKNEDGSIASTWELPNSSEVPEPILVITYRNTEPLQPIKAENFASLEAAVAYIKKTEPAIPRASLNACAPEPPPSWGDYLIWLNDRGLCSAANAVGHKANGDLDGRNGSAFSRYKGRA